MEVDQETERKLEGEDLGRQHAIAGGVTEPIPHVITADVSKIRKVRRPNHC